MLARRPENKLRHHNGAGNPSPATEKVAPVTEKVAPATSPLERNPMSPRGWKKRDSDGVGLGILAKLDSAAAGGEFSGGVRRRKLLFCGRSGVSGGEFPVADFLRCCYLCGKRLHGKDIFMYRGEKGFCSKECRYQQIVSDECKENWGSEVLRRAELSSSPCSGDGAGDRGGRLFFAGITAAY